MSKLDLLHLRIGPYRIQDVTAIFLLAALGASLVVRFLQRKSQASTRPSTPDLEQKSPERKPGGYLPPSTTRYTIKLTLSYNPEWIPSDFKRPPASPYPDWDVHTTKPIPYRPFRYGP
ncbi:uncharacterized protein LDX57_004062 [Aspergillus melleus]|uniref:uncharacterized protein n=1 Tax=Aspergillus melleus TaxID=138277 RepID=UPI001E8DF8B9|nr:uncharacterized protein LDX57_004062 [Aspergillus melleus]KAH8426316.1 hypothetical protein LDX57_004062 [Aspergillus melleus]